MRGESLPKPTPKTVQIVFKRDKGMCIYCGKPASELDHVVRIRDHSPNNSSNLVCSCRSCNIYKKNHPNDIGLLTRAIFWLINMGEDISWMKNHYSLNPILNTSHNIFNGKPAKVIKTPRFPTQHLSVRQPKPRKELSEKREITTSFDIATCLPQHPHKTVMVRVRIPIEVLDIIERRAKKYPGEMTVSGYIRMTLEYMILRKHVKTRHTLTA